MDGDVVLASVVAVVAMGGDVVLAAVVLLLWVVMLC